MAKVKKGNKVLHVDEKAVASYLKEGFDQIGENGKIVKRATAGKSISTAEYNKVTDENEKLQAQVKKLEADLKKAKEANK